MNVLTPVREFEVVDDYDTRLPDGERVIERKDPVLWSDWTAQAPITSDEAAHYRDRGYLVRENQFSQDELDLLISTSLKLRSDTGDICREDLITEPNSDAVRTVFRLDENSATFDRLARDSRLAGVAKFLLGDDVYVHQSRLNYKPGFTGKEFYWHSDFETWHAEDGMPRMRAVSASLLLTDNNRLNGPLMLIPGSQNRFVACQGETPEDNHATSLKKQEVGVPSRDALERMVEELGLDAATGPTGTLIFFDCNTLHASNGNVTPWPRSNAFFVFNAVSNRLAAPFAAAKPRPAFLANRGGVKAITPISGPLHRG